MPNPGAIPSAPDYRANIVAAALAAISATPTPTLPVALATDLTKLGAPLNQMQTPSCVSHSIAMLMRLWWYLKTGQIVLFSPRYLHIRSGLVAGAGPNDGRDPISVMKIAMQYGCATEATCPNDTTLSPADYLNLAITPAMDAEAAAYKIPGYAPITPTQFGIRQAIAKYGAVSLLMQISNAFWTDKNGNVTYAQAAIDPVRAPASQADIISGHELTGNEFDASLDGFINSWGATWAKGGSSDYLFNEWENYIVEAVAIAEIPPATLALVQGLPAAGEFKHNFTTTISYGSSGDEVRALQIALAIDGDFGYPEITGFYGTITQQAVLAFQKKYNVAPLAELQSLNGRSVGPLTQAALNKLFNH